MGLVVCSPYGLMREESGVLGLLANYLSKSSWPVSLLRCNGAFSICDRDGESGWRREPESCFACMQEQSCLAGWAAVPVHELSSFLLAEDVLESKRWVLELTSDEHLLAARFHDHPVFDLCRGSFHYRFGLDHPDLRNKNQEQALRRLMMSAVRAILACERFNRQAAPELALVSGGGDYISAVYSACARRQGSRVAQFVWDLAARTVRVIHPVSNREYACPLVFEDVTSMRADSRTWPFELIQILDELLVFLDVTSSQLELPIAR